MLLSLLKAAKLLQYNQPSSFGDELLVWSSLGAFTITYHLIHLHVTNMIHICLAADTKPTKPAIKSSTLPRTSSQG